MALEESPDLTTTLANLTSAISGQSSWPLDKSETFAAFALMGLTSRLQPVTVGKREDKERLVKLALELGAMTCDAIDAGDLAPDVPSKKK